MRGLGLNNLTVAGLTFAVILLASACAAPAAKVADRNVSRHHAEIVAQVRERSIAYPEVEVTDFVDNPPGIVACALLRIPGKRPLVINAMRDPDGDGFSISGPYLYKPGSWDDARNRGLSDFWAKECQRSGAPLPAF